MGPLIWLLACWPVGAAASGPKHLVKGVHNGLLHAHLHSEDLMRELPLPLDGEGHACEEGEACTS